MSGDAFLDQGPPRRHHDLAAAIAVAAPAAAWAALAWLAARPERDAWSES